MQAQWTDKDRIRFHFSFIRDFDITLSDMSLIALQSNAFSRAEYEQMEKTSDTMIERENFLKLLLRKDINSCSAFLASLQQGRFNNLYNVIVCSNGNHNETGDISGEMYSSITRHLLEQNIDFVIQNLEVVRVLDMLFERGIIMIDEHDQIQRKQTRKQKRETLLQKLLSRRNAAWLPIFITTLRLTGHDDLLNRLMSIAEQALIPPIGLQLGHTSVIPTDYIARLSSSSSTRGQLDSIVDSDLSVIQECIEANVIEIWEGSIYFHLSTSSPQTILSILHGNDEMTLKDCLQRLFSGNRTLLLHFSKDQIIQFELEEKPKDVFINRGYGKIKDGKEPNPTYRTNHCTECYQTTLRENYDLVLDEIEDDIIQDTKRKLDEAHSTRGYVTKGSLFKQGTRREKSITFLQYVLCNEDALQAFRKAFSYRSQVVLVPHKCSICSGKIGDLVPYKSSKRVFYFTMTLDDIDSTRVGIKIVNSQMQLPSILFKTMAYPDKYRRPERSISMVEIPYTKVSDDYRIVVIGQAKWRAEFFACAKRTMGKMLKFYELPDFQQNRKKLAEEDKQQRIAHCIARSSPGPHAFLFVTDLIPEPGKEISFDPYLQFFGSEFMEFLVLMFTVKDDLSTAEDFLEKSSYWKIILNQCSWRYVIYPAEANEVIMRNQTRKLISQIDGMLKKNKRPYYTSAMYEKSEKEVQTTMKIIESQKQSTIQILQKETKNIEMLDARNKAAEQLRSQASFIKMVNEESN